MDTLQRVRNCLVETLELEESDVTPEARLREDLDVDSLEAVEVAMALEEAFELEDILTEDLERAKTVADIVVLIDSHITEPATLQT